MGNPRPRPIRLAEKLLNIRLALGLSQSEMLRRLGIEGQVNYTQISEYERDKREPTLMVLLEYARVAGVYLEDLVDDELDLPARLPGPSLRLPEAATILTRSNKRLHHFCAAEVAAKLVQFVQPEIVAVEIVVWWISGIAAQVAEILHQHKGTIEFVGFEERMIDNLT